MTWRHRFDSLLSGGCAPQEVDDRICSVLNSGHSKFYDRGAWLYDLIIGGRSYNRYMWGCSVDCYRRNCEQAIAGSDGPMIDVGCGSLIFTDDAYANSREQLIVLVDMSIGMLRRARDRLLPIRQGNLENIVLLQADAKNLPFKPASFARTLSWGVLHVMPDEGAFVAELKRVTRPEGVVSLSSLVTDRGFGRGYLKLLKKTGEVAQLMSSEDIKTLMKMYDMIADVSVVGSMAFVSAHSQ